MRGERGLAIYNGGQPEKFRPRGGLIVQIWPDNTHDRDTSCTMHTNNSQVDTQERNEAFIEEQRGGESTANEPGPSETYSSDHNNYEERKTEPNDKGQTSGSSGYAHLAKFMINTQHSMIRRHKELSLMNLLYLQAEIHQLKSELDKETAADAADRGFTERGSWDHHWFSLATSGERGTGERWELWLKLRRRLYEYCTHDGDDLHTLFILMKKRLLIKSRRTSQRRRDRETRPYFQARPPEQRAEEEHVRIH